MFFSIFTTLTTLKVVQSNHTYTMIVVTLKTPFTPCFAVTFACHVVHAYKQLIFYTTRIDVQLHKINVNI